jgi:hypothetical protein
VENLSSVRLLQKRETAGERTVCRLHHGQFQNFYKRALELAASEIPCAGDWASPGNHLTPFIRAWQAATKQRMPPCLFHAGPANLSRQSVTVMQSAARLYRVTVVSANRI